MPSMEESKRNVKEGLNSHSDVNHDAILASLQDEIDRHNTAGERHDRNTKERSSMKFRFKSNTSDPRKRKHRSQDHERSRDAHRRRRRRGKDDREGNESGAAHPFPREPTNPEQDGQHDANAAFRDSLFDALADDEGAAYWESVYSQPVHVYSRPSVMTDKGETDQMNDEEYAAYVQTKMWEKKNPHIVLERERKEKQKKEEEEERARRREEFIRRKERAAWEKSQRDGAGRFAGVGADENSGTYEYTFDFMDKQNRSSVGDTCKEYRDAWTTYSAAWDRLKIDLLNARDSGSLDAYCSESPSKKIPWPVLPSKPAIKQNIEDFMRHMPIENSRSKLQQLKAERVKWHPDKVQQRFVGHVDEGTMKVVTGIFQVIDFLVEQERKVPQG